MRTCSTPHNPWCDECVAEVERQTERADHWQHQFHVMGEAANKAEREVERLQRENEQLRSDKAWIAWHKREHDNKGEK